MAKKFLVTVEEVKDNKIGCGTILIIAIIFACIALGKDDEADSKKEPNKTVAVESVSQAKSTAKPVESKAQDVVPVIREESVGVVSEEETEEPAASSGEVAQGQSTIEQQEGIEEAALEIVESNAREEILAAEKKVNKLFNVAKRSCRKKNITAARATLAEMESLKSSLSSENAVVDNKITEIKQMIEELEEVEKP